jgi:K+-transporting ATPase ATPase C chain
MKRACIIFVFFTLLYGGAYPLLIYGIGQLFFHKETTGSLVQNRDGKFIGSLPIGQNFQRPEYFHPRPSAEN